MRGDRRRAGSRKSAARPGRRGREAARTTCRADYTAWCLDEAKHEADTAALIYRALLDHAHEIPTWAWGEAVERQ